MFIEMEVEGNIMSQRNVSGSGVKQQVKRSTQQAVRRPWFSQLARLGYAVAPARFISGNADSRELAVAFNYFALRRIGSR